jgi:hypothetical protein
MRKIIKDVERAWAGFFRGIATAILFFLYPFVWVVVVLYVLYAIALIID